MTPEVTPSDWFLNMSLADELLADLDDIADEIGEEGEQQVR